MHKDTAKAEARLASDEATRAIKEADVADRMAINAVGHEHSASVSARNADHYEQQAQSAAARAASYGPSDVKLKTQVQLLGNVQSKLLALKPATYLFRTEEFPSLHLPANKQYGLIAQELEKVFPHLVHEETTGGVNHKSVDYIGLNILLVKGLQEQNEQINLLKLEIDELKSEIFTAKRSDIYTKGL